MIVRDLVELKPWRLRSFRLHGREILRVGERARAVGTVGQRFPAVGRERTEQRVRCGHGGKRREVDVQPEEPVDRLARECFRALIDPPVREQDRQARRVRPSHVRHG
jgi:hypothetical protein